MARQNPREPTVAAGRQISLMRYLNRTRLAPGLRVLFASALLLLAACGSTQTPPEAGPGMIKIVQDGGCQMMGPNCPTYELSRDGTVRLFRTGEAAVVSEATLDTAVTDELWHQIADTNIAALTERAGPGTCRACVDGVDTVITYTNSEEEVTLDSTMIAFDDGEPFFAVFNEAIEAMAAAAPMPIQQR